MIGNRKLRRALKAVGLGKAEPAQASNEVRNKYFQKCAEAGELQYKIGAFQKALTEMNQEIEKLNQAYGELQAKERAEQGAKAQAQAQSVEKEPNA